RRVAPVRAGQDVLDGRLPVDLGRLEELEEAVANQTLAAPEGSPVGLVALEGAICTGGCNQEPLPDTHIRQSSRPSPDIGAGALWRTASSGVWRMGRRRSRRVASICVRISGPGQRESARGCRLFRL